MLYRYAAIVKNLRGVVWFSYNRDVYKLMEKLSKKFRYRNLGVSKALVNLHGDLFKGKLNGKPFHILDFPTEKVSKLANRLLDVIHKYKISKEGYEAVLLASSYVSPLIILGHDSLKELEKLIVHTVRGPEKLNDIDVKLHLRIVDYSVLDGFIWSVKKVIEGVQGNNLKLLIEERKAYCIRDAKRFWRINGKGDKLWIAYLDVLKPFENVGLNSFKELIDEESGILFSVMTAFVL